jgi:GNAT superfamily N-acetyltransferase
MLIRNATHDDWPQIWPVVCAIASQGETYALPEPLGSDQARSLWLEPEPWHVVVALSELGTLIGTAKMGPNRPGRGSHVATASFMVAPQAQGQGVGRRMGEYALDWARQQGYRSMQFNAVVESNKAAVALWKSLGFRVLATVPEAFDHRRLGLVGLHIMYLPLDAHPTNEPGP